MLERYIGESLGKIADEYPEIQEIRIRVGQNVCIYQRSGCNYTNFFATRQYIDNVFSALCNYSVYAVQEEIRNGFITLPNGNRAGICGKCVVKDSKVRNIYDISSINIRIAREYKNCSAKIYKHIKNDIGNLVFISPPNCGKTTYLRDLVRLCSDNGNNISVVDERGEIAPVLKEKVYFDVGKNTDVYQFCPKKEGVMMALRTMNPKIIATDEIGSDEDIMYISEIMKSGVYIFTTFHGFDVNDFKNRFSDWKNFKYAVILNARKEVENIVCLK